MIKNKAAAHNSFNIMELLVSDERSLVKINEPSRQINYKIDLKLVDLNENSALHLALLNGHENCALFILDRIESNSNLVNLKNHQGNYSFN